MGESIVNEDVTKKEDCGVDVDGVRVNKLFGKIGMRKSKYLTPDF